MTKTRIAENIKRLRIERGFAAAKDLARASGVSPSVVSELEAGRRKPSWIENLDRITTALDVSMGELVGETNWVSIPSILDEFATTANLSYTEAKELSRSWLLISKLLREAPGALKVLLDHPEFLETLGKGDTTLDSRTFVLLDRQQPAVTVTKGESI